MNTVIILTHLIVVASLPSGVCNISSLSNGTHSLSNRESLKGRNAPSARLAVMRQLTSPTKQKWSPTMTNVIDFHVGAEGKTPHMTAPGNIDEQGWRVPIKPRACKLYYLAKAGLNHRQIAELTGLTLNSVKVMLHHIRHPKRTVFGWRWRNVPKTGRRLGIANKKQAYEPTMHPHRVIYLKPAMPPEHPKSQSEKAYHGWRYSGKSRRFHQLDS